MADNLSIVDGSDEFAIQLFKEVYTFELQECSHDEFATVIQDFKEMF